MSVSTIGESKLLAKLEEAISSEHDEVRIACYRGEWAAIKARQGHHDDARAAIASLRRAFEDRRHPEVSVWLFVAESFVAHYSNIGDAARDRMKRALAVSSSAGLLRLKALSAAWLAHYEYYRDEPDEMAKYLKLGFEAVDHADRSTLTRANMVVAMAYHFGGRFDLAQPWYRKAREHAVIGGDDVFLGALNSNIAAIRAVQAQQAAALGNSPIGDINQVLAFAESATSLDQRVRTSSFPSLLPFIKAVVAAVQGRFVDAVSLYDTILPRLADEGLANMRAAILADMAWCYLMAEQKESAYQYAIEAVQCHRDTDHVEDQLVAYARLAQVFEGLGDVEKAATYALRAKDMTGAHQKLQQRFLGAVEGIHIAA